MIYKQRKFRNRTEYEFRKERLLYTIKSPEGKFSFIIDYASIPFEKHLEQEERNPWFQNAGFFWVAIGIIQISFQYYEHGQIQGSFWLILGIICLFAFYYFKTEFTIIPTKEGNLFIVNDKYQSRIINEINKRRALQLKKSMVK